MRNLEVGKWLRWMVLVTMIAAGLMLGVGSAAAERGKVSPSGEDLSAGTAAVMPAAVPDASAATLTVDGACVDGNNDGACDSSSAYKTLQAAIAAASSGDTINILAGTYVEAGQIVISKNLTIAGADRATTIIKTDGDTGGTGDARGWFLVPAGVTFNLSAVTLDGEGHLVHSAIRTHGDGTLDNIAFKNIRYTPSSYDGRGVSAVGDVVESITVSNSTFENIGRIGVHVFGSTTANITGNTYTGKGSGDWLDYAFEVGGGGHMTLTKNTVSGCVGVALVDNSTSAAVLATTYFASGTTATIENNTITGNTGAVAVGFNTSDTSTVVVHNNDLSGNALYAVGSTTPLVDASANWWGSNDQATVKTAADEGDFEDYTPWLGSSTDTSTDPGFQGDFATLYVGADSVQSGTVGRIQEAVSLATAGGTVNVAAGTYTPAGTIVINKTDVKLLGAGAANTFVKTSGTAYLFQVSASGFTLEGFDIEKTDKTGVQNIVTIQGNNATIKNNTFHGQYVLGDGDVSRALEVSGGISVTVEGNTIYALRQPAYINTASGLIKNNLVYGTRGWVVDGGNPVFEGNTWGTGNAIDIAILSGVPANYPDIVAMSEANNDAVIEDQRPTPRVLSVVYVDDSAAAGGTGGQLDAFQTITPAMARVVAGGKVKVAAGTYTESFTVGKAMRLFGPQKDVAVAGRTAAAATEATVSGLMTVSAGPTTINGFTLRNAGGTYAVSVTAAAADVTIQHNIVDNVGAVGLGSNVHAIVASSGPDNLRILDNRFNNIKAGAKSVSAIGILDSTASNSSTGLVVDGNTFTDIASTGGKGAYGIILNNKAGVPDAQITDNSFSNLSGSWTHAIGLEGPTPGAAVTGNTFTALTASGADNAAVHFEANPGGASVTVANNQFNGGGYYGVLINPSDLPDGTNGLNYIVTAENNWWNSACGPKGANAALAGTNVDYSPWYTTPTGPDTRTAGPNGEIFVPAGAPLAEVQAILNCAGSGATVLFSGGTYPGGLVITTNGVTINFNGATVGHGSPAVIVDADNVTLNGPVIFDGTGNSDSSAGILVQTGADNFTLRNAEVRNWRDGIEIDGSHASLKLFGNWLHNNTESGLQVNSGAVLTGIVTVQGNLFKANGGAAVESAVALNAEYNSWGTKAAPAAMTNVDADPWTFAEIYFDVDTAGDQVVYNVNETNAFTVKLMAEAENLYGLSFKFTYDAAKLTLTGTTFAAPWNGACAELTGLPAGTLAYRCNLTSGDEWDGGEIATLNLTAKQQVAGDGPWEALFDIAAAEADTSAGAKGGVKVFVNNAGFGATGRDITDGDDGKIIIHGLAQFTGYVDLQGRTDDSGALLSVYKEATVSGPTLMATATSASGGKYTTAYATLQQLVIGQTYYFQFDRDLYLPTTVRNPLGTSWADSKLLDTRPETVLGTLILLGGDADNDDLIGVDDASCIGGDYNQAPSLCGTTVGSSSDVTGDGKVDVLDLTLMGGNFDKTSSPWAQ